MLPILCGADRASSKHAASKVKRGSRGVGRRLHLGLAEAEVSAPNKQLSIQLDGPNGSA
jgi:hypothetical protein